VPTSVFFSASKLQTNTAPVVNNYISISASTAPAPSIAVYTKDKIQCLHGDYGLGSSSI